MEPLELGSVVALCLLTSTPISIIPLSLEGKRKWEASGFILFLFFAKGLLPVSELWLSPLMLSLQCPVRLSRCVYACVCLCLYHGEGCLF